MSDIDIRKCALQDIGLALDHIEKARKLISDLPIDVLGELIPRPFAIDATIAMQRTDLAKKSVTVTHNHIVEALQ